MTTELEGDSALGIFFRQMSEEKSVDQMVEKISAFARIFNCSSIAYGPQTSVQNMQMRCKIKLPTLPTLLTYPKEWQEHCLKNGYDRLAPSLWMGHSQSGPLLWDHAYKDPNTTGRERRIFDEAKELGLETGVTIQLPERLGNFPTMSFVQSERSGLSKTAVWSLQSAARVFHEKVEGCVDWKAGFPSLTARETECIGWVAKERTSLEIAIILRITSHTVDFHIKHVLAKWGVESRKDAAMLAEHLGLIEPRF
ncbi:LuxR family transcriptional regulator (plasmid) [Sinorhizobium meliloti]|uniref:helix-turn-helix transcriptional regulator n=1 Tax=Rhizobium meliloti TaxID=382 RepID=UPI000B49CA16|nr:LuxR family transcriptional regulator [Sinorhizobium meliloti]ASP89500.1 LuxR family transcriptional regulator [Sinorhizobium meliloti]MQW24152.1 LuxR family transcriptional regulator [Sinorhizobium meliloti]